MRGCTIHTGVSSGASAAAGGDSSQNCVRPAPNLRHTVVLLAEQVLGGDQLQQQDTTVCMSTTLISALITTLRISWRVGGEGVGFSSLAFPSLLATVCCHSATKNIKKTHKDRFGREAVVGTSKQARYKAAVVTQRIFKFGAFHLVKPLFCQPFRSNRNSSVYGSHLTTGLCFHTSISVQLLLGWFEWPQVSGSRV